MTKQKSKKLKTFRKRIIAFLLLICLCLSFAVWQTNSIVISDFLYSNSKIPAAFEGFKILQLSDVHNKTFGKNQSVLLRLIEDAHPDLIVITGDIIDNATDNLDSITELFVGAAAFAPVYYVEGNHDRVPQYYESLRDIAKQHGITLLDNDQTMLMRGQSAIRLVGIADPIYFADESEYENMLDYLLRQSADDFTILLSHRPEKMELYEKYAADLCFTGHVHGGQIAIPLIGPVYAPNQGYFQNIYQACTKAVTRRCL